MDKDDVSRKASEYGLMLSLAGLTKIVENNLDYERIFSKAKLAGEWFITPEYIENEFPEGHQKDECIPQTEAGSSRKACEIKSKLIIHEDSDVTGKSTCSGEIEDFIQYFNKRFSNIKKVIMERVEYRGAITIDALKKIPEKERTRIVGMVSEKRESSKGHKFFKVEDPTGEITVFIKDDEKLDRLYQRILLDEVIGLEGVRSGDLFITSEITQPDIPISHNTNYADEEVYACFLSDIHVGSYLFLENEFQTFTDWLKGKGGRKEISERVKYIFIAGDLVDGIGIYPGQEKELTIPDIEKQYEFLALILSEIPEHIQIIACMGNHDAVRNAEPQPAVGKDIAPALHNMPNLAICGNPVRFSAHDVEFLMYHGTSMDTIIGSLSGCKYSQPEIAMVEYLIRRNLVPTYGSGGIAQEEKDYLFIGDVPDVFHCGHVHTNGYAKYKGVHIINSGTFQAKTAYQERQGHQPTPARVPVMNLQNHEFMILDFTTDGQIQ